jgi:hypothetical protein
MSLIETDHDLVTNLLLVMLLKMMVEYVDVGLGVEPLPLPTLLLRVVE